MAEYETRKKILYCTALICFLVGTAGILISSHSTTSTYSQLTFIISSLLLGLSPSLFIFSPTSQNKNENLIIASLLFLVAIIKVLGLHIKYGLYLGCDSVAEFGVIKSLFLQPTFELTSNALTEFPLSYISVYMISTITNVNPIAESWNFTHLFSHALTVIFLYLLIKNIFDRDIAVISCIAYMYNPAVSIYSLSMTRENYGTLFLVTSIYIMQIQAKRNRPSGVLVYIIICTALIFSHYTTSYFNLLTLSLLFLTGFILHFSKTKNKDSKKYRNFYVLFFSAVLFLWIFDLTYHHQGDIRIADHMLRGITDLFKSKEMEISSSSETTKILSDFSFVQTLYKLQAFYIAIGSFYLLAQIRNLSGYQRIFAVVAFFDVCLIALSSVVPSLANSLSPTRIMRFGIILGCIPVGYISVRMKSKVEPDKQKNE
ncbi:glycosyltransferase family 39 protein [Methanosarcina horonobensis]|uniref:glycosyltransferase family 39 protein n=1 Tax=Methanosarcina horonobensis TaxID=418008 RepID=UPI000AD775C2|nr:glycosyltransferase family 39 protein [Methanosarcina horonobensis]